MVIPFLTIFLVAIFGLADASPQKTLYASAPVNRGAYYVRGRRVYNYGYNTGDGIAKVEARHPDGSVTGSYRYFDPLGRQILRSYIADEKGFRVLGNALPVGPETPAYGRLPEETLYGTAEGTGDPSASNDYTSTFLLNNQLGTTSTRANTPNQPAYSESRKSKVIREQDELIRQYERQLEQLKQQRLNLLSNRPIDHKTVASRNVEAGYSGANLNQHGGIYFYHDKKRDYDFPAGFAYGPRAESTFSRSATSRDGSSSNSLLVIDNGSGNVRYRPLLRRRSGSARW